MLNAGALLFDGAGRVRCTLSPPVNFNGSVVTNTGLLCISSAAGASGPNGFRYNPNLGVDHVGVIAVYLGGLGFTAAGLLCTEQSTTPVRWVEGLPLGATDRVVLAPTEAPLSLTGFSNGYDSGFG
jgi:hypothetical protein